MLVRLEVGILVASHQALSEPLEPVGLHLESDQLLEDVVHQKWQLMAEAVHLDFNACQAFRPHLYQQ